MRKGTPIPREELIRLATETMDAKKAGRSLPPQPHFAEPSNGATPDSSDLFDPAALESILTLAEPYSMPDGKTVWVHPAGIEDEIWINLQAAREVRDLKLTDPDEIRYQNLLRGQVYQVIAVCRRSDRPDSPLIFSPRHAEALRTNQAYRAAVKQISAISDRLSGDGFTRSAFDAYFFALEERLTGLSGQLTGDSQAEVSRLASSIRLTRQRGRLSVSDLEEADETERMEAREERDELLHEAIKAQQAQAESPVEA